jgi:beta-lactamase regulating signal transducer with metallopeptidase domain
MDFGALQHSIFLQALGSAILNSLWQVFILWLLYETISVSYKNASARFRNYLGTTLLFLSFIWFVTTFFSKVTTQQAAESLLLAPTNVIEIPNGLSGSSLDAFISYAGSSLPYLSVAYIFLLFFLIAKLFTAYRYVYTISNKRLLSPPVELQVFANKLSAQTGITRKIGVWISNHIDVPATIGFIKPVILIPLASLNNLSEDQLEAIILHELSHIKRNDYIINIMIAVIETILFFNPFVVLLSKVIKRERENCCDDFVLRYRYDPHSYATALLRLEQSRAHNLKLAIGAVSGKKQLLSRIKRITTGQATSRQFNYGQKLLALLLVTGIICSVAWLSPGEKKPASNKVLTRGTESIPLPKENLSPQLLSVPYYQKEDLQADALKHRSPKKDFLPPREAGIPRFDAEPDDKLNINENIANIVKRYKEDSTFAMNLNEAQFFFDGKELNLKLPPLRIKNFPFQNTDFNIDLGKIDMNKFDENLKQACKEISDINWNKVQNDIRESLSKMKVTNFPSKERSEFFVEKAKEFYKLKGDKQKFEERLPPEKLNREIRLRDSLNRRSMILIYENAERVQREYRRIENQSAENMGENSYYSYDGSPAAKNTDNAPTVWISGNNTSSTGSKNIKITVKHLPGTNNTEHLKKLLQISFDTNPRKTGDDNAVSVEVTDLP